jgi:hypothetical protein
MDRVSIQAKLISKSASKLLKHTGSTTQTSWMENHENLLAALRPKTGESHNENYGMRR